MKKSMAVSRHDRQLTHLRELAPRIGAFAVAPLGAGQITATLAVLAGHYGPDISPECLVPPADGDALRADLARAAPQLIDLAGELREALEGRYSAVVVPQLGIGHLPVSDRAALLFALAAALGVPTATDKVTRRVVWDVKVRKEKFENNTVSTFSEHPHEADLHTDTQYFEQPERYMLLYVVEPASCGGGISTMRALQSMRRELLATPEGCWAMEYLTGRELPFRIPAVFTRDGKGDKAEVTFAPIFGARPAIRYRLDTLNKGLELYPELDTQELRRALNIVDHAANNPDQLVTLSMPSDSLQLLNNHEALHGRSPFTDFNRHVLRIRIAETATRTM